jgi:hypothetical protein
MVGRSKFLTCIREEPDWNLGSSEIFRNFPLLADVCTVQAHLRLARFRFSRSPISIFINYSTIGCHRSVFLELPATADHCMGGRRMRGSLSYRNIPSDREKHASALLFLRAGKKLQLKTKLNSVAVVRKRTIPTKRPSLVGEVTANFCG